MRTTLRRNGPRGFTLVEILVVISIIIILVGTVLALGAGLRARAQIHQTKATLSVLKTALQKYLDEGNPESALFGITTPPPYVSTSAAQTGFATAFRSIPSSAKALQGLTQTASSAATTVMDGFGNPIQYIQSTADRPGFFQSAGPDGIYGPPVGPDGVLGTADDGPVDDIFSYDP